MGIFAEVASKLVGRPIRGELRWYLKADYLKNRLLSDAQAQTAITFQFELYQALLDADLFDVEHLGEIHSSIANRTKMIARHSPKTRRLIFQTLFMLIRVHAPLWMRRAWGWIKMRVASVMPTR
jgi:hypothetical protein